MVLRYWGERGVDAESFAHLVDRSAAGIRTTALIGELRRRGWDAFGVSGSDGRLGRELANGRPVMSLIEDRPGTYHYVVIVAATERAVIFHDPARAPLRVMNRLEFNRRWNAADRWMAVIVPRPADALELSPSHSAAVPRSRCEALVAEGIQHARANNLEAAERSLAAALTCPGPASWRELAGVRLLQRRWPDVTELASAALAIDGSDEHSWRLLGTSRFVQNDPAGALDAWNQVGEPRVDLVGVAGLVRTRQRPVERLLGVARGELLTAEVFRRARRRLDELPAALSTRLEYVPAPSGLAELRGTIDERPLLPSDVWSYAAIGLGAAAGREVEVSTGSLTGGGEGLAVAWRFWPERERLAVRLASPASWGGTWSVDGAATRESFDRLDVPTAERIESRLTVAQWIAAPVRIQLSGGIARWEGRGAYGGAGAGVRVVDSGERFQVDGGFNLWMGEEAFVLGDVRLTARSSAARRGRVYLARGGIGVASELAPEDLWFAGDTGHARSVLLRAHPLLRENQLHTAQLGRRIGHASGEIQQWWTVAVARVAGAVFVDAARVFRRFEGTSRGDVDAGLGARLAIPGVRGVFRADLARGLRDGATTVSFVYEP